MNTDKRFEVLLAISTGLLVIYLITLNEYLLYCIISFNVLVLLIKPFSRLVAFAWLKLSEILGTVSSVIILSLLYYLFLTPIALLYRLINRNKLKIRRDETKSMFVSRDYKYTPKDLEFTW